MFYEIRRYRTRPGRRDDSVTSTEEVVLPFQYGAGMTPVASFTDDEDPDAYVWIRRFEDEDDRIRLYRAVYESETWRDEIGPRVEELLIRDDIVVTRATPTPASRMQ